MSRRRSGAGAAALVCGAALLLGGCARAGGTPRQQVAGWASQTGIVALDQTVATDVSDVEGALHAGKNLTAKTVCDALYNDAGQAYINLPSPDVQLTNLLDSAYLALSQGANDCDLALGSGSKSQLTKALDEIHTGDAALIGADNRLAALGVATATGGTGATGGS